MISRPLIVLKPKFPRYLQASSHLAKVNVSPKALLNDDAHSLLFGAHSWEPEPELTVQRGAFAEIWKLVKEEVKIFVYII